MAAPGSFPLLVEGSWGPDPPESLPTKLQLYFQSARRSGGGACEVLREPGSPPRFLVVFHLEDGEGFTGCGDPGQPGSPPKGGLPPPPDTQRGDPAGLEPVRLSAPGGLPGGGGRLGARGARREVCWRRSRCSVAGLSSREGSSRGLRERNLKGRGSVRGGESCLNGFLGGHLGSRTGRLLGRTVGWERAREGWLSPRAQAGPAAPAGSPRRLQRGCLYFILFSINLFLTYF